MSLDQRITQYYFSNLDQLPQDKQFHFATRIAAWTGSSQAFDLLRALRAYIAPANVPLKDLLHDIANAEPTGKRNAHELREPFFAKYPLLYGAHSMLFRVRHLQAVYGIDARDALLQVYSKADFDLLADQLQADTPALRTLSTFAVNYVYLYRQILFGQSIDPSLFMAAATAYDRTDMQDIQLLMYLYTHCIIGESNFYTQRIPAKKLPMYQQMLAELEPILSTQYQLINLDNKLEFLVCCRICNYDTPLSATVQSECLQSISQEGTFLIDRHNQNIQADRAGFERSEHRNVLYVMSQSPYNPHSTLVS